MAQLVVILNLQNSVASGSRGVHGHRDDHGHHEGSGTPPGPPNRKPGSGRSTPHPPPTLNSGPHPPPGYLPARESRCSQMTGTNSAPSPFPAYGRRPLRDSRAPAVESQPRALKPLNHLPKDKFQSGSDRNGVTVNQSAGSTPTTVLPGSSTPKSRSAESISLRSAPPKSLLKGGSPPLTLSDRLLDQTRVLQKRVSSELCSPVTRALREVSESGDLAYPWEELAELKRQARDLERELDLLVWDIGYRKIRCSSPRADQLVDWEEQIGACEGKFTKLDEKLKQAKTVGGKSGSGQAKTAGQPQKRSNEKRVVSETRAAGAQPAVQDRDVIDCLCGALSSERPSPRGGTRGVTGSGNVGVNGSCRSTSTVNTKSGAPSLPAKKSPGPSDFPVSDVDHSAGLYSHGW